jgi:hypothetical protein
VGADSGYPADRDDLRGHSSEKSHQFAMQVTAFKRNCMMRGSICECNS